jgi:hypothetical protein
MKTDCGDQDAGTYVLRESGTWVDLLGPSTSDRLGLDIRGGQEGGRQYHP